MQQQFRTGSCLLALGILVLTGPSLMAQSSVLDSAAVLEKSGMPEDAIALLERHVAAGSTDYRVHEDLGMRILGRSGAPKDASARRAARVRARAHLVRAVQLGARDVVTTTMAAGIPVDGGDDAVFSDNPVVADAMRKGEAAFSAGDMRTAFNEYQRALAADPTEYSAALFQR